MHEEQRIKKNLWQICVLQQSWSRAILGSSQPTGGQLYYAMCLPSNYLRSLLTEESMRGVQFFGVQTQTRSARNQNSRCSSLDCTSEAGEESQPNAAFELRGGPFDDPLPSPQSCLSCVRYARQGFLASAAWECSPDEPFFTTCLLRSAHRKLERKNVSLKTQGEDLTSF